MDIDDVEDDDLDAMELAHVWASFIAQAIHVAAREGIGVNLVAGRAAEIADQMFTEWAKRFLVDSDEHACDTTCAAHGHYKLKLPGEGSH